VVTIQPSDGGLVVVLGNDCDEPWAGDVVLTRHAFDGSVIVAEDDRGVRAGARLGDGRRPRGGRGSGRPGIRARRGEALGRGGLWFFCRAARQHAAAARTTVSVTWRTDAGFDVTVTAHETLVRDLTLLVDKVDAQASGRPWAGHAAAGGVGHVPGDAGSAPWTWARCAAPGILRCANELVHA
jgi:beta-mannosidase